MQESVAPDYAEPLLGWRGWFVVETAGSARLYSPLYRTVWQPLTETVALCHREPPPAMWAPRSLPTQHEAPSEDCRCGIYASCSVAAAAKFVRGRGGFREAAAAVVGQVFLWGRVVECKHGWRGAYAYPARIYLASGRPGRSRFPTADAGTAERLAAALGAYGVPVELVACETVSELAGTLARADAQALAEGGEPTVTLSGLAKALKRLLALGKAK